MSSHEHGKKPQSKSVGPVIFDDWIFTPNAGTQVKFRAQRGADLMSALTYDGSHGDAADYKSVWVDGQTRSIINSFTNDHVGELKRSNHV